MQAEVVDRAATVAAEDAGGVCIVDHQDRAVSFGDSGEGGERSDAAVHGKDAVRDEKFAAGLVGQAGQLLLGRGDILVGKHVNGGAREPAAVDDAGVVELVGDDVVV